MPENMSSCSSTDNQIVSDGHKERRREAHTQAEQKRRDAIKRGYENLQNLVPTCQQQDSISSYKLSKATILQRSIDHIESLQNCKVQQDGQLKTLQKEVKALLIMRDNYQQLLKQQQDIASRENQSQQTNRMSEQMKFELFRAFCDSLFVSFEQCVTFNDFKQMSLSVFNWIEEYCKPQTLKNICLSILQENLLY